MLYLHFWIVAVNVILHGLWDFLVIISLSHQTVGAKSKETMWFSLLLLPTSVPNIVL